jgi:diacylglycerol kinase family enzyme
MVLFADDPRAEEALVEESRDRRICALDCDVIEAWHARRTMKRVVLIVNPFASRVDDATLTAVERALMRGAYVRTVRTQRPRHAVELARESQDADAVVVFSGDGGFNEVLNGVERDDLPVGFVPGGGTSVLPRALGLPRDPLEAAEHLADALAHDRTHQISTGRVNGRRFAFNAGIGIDAEAVRRVDELGRSPEGRRPGDFAFVGTFAKILFERRGRFDPVLEVVGYGRAALVLVSNGAPYTFLKALAIQTAPQAAFAEGLDFLAPHSLTPRTLPPLLLALATGRPARNAFRGHDLDRIEVRCDAPLPLQADGEDLGDVTEAVFEAERGAVTVLG